MLVNAHTGKILESFDMVHTAAATGTGSSQYSGTVSIGTNTTGQEAEGPNCISGASH